MNFIKGETYLFHGISAQFHSVYKPNQNSSLLEYRFIQATSTNLLINSARAISIKNYENYLKVSWWLVNPSNGYYQPLTSVPISLRNLKWDQKNKIRLLQQFAFVHSIEGYEDMLMDQSRYLFKPHLGPRLPGSFALKNNFLKI
jgi:hypothetical protein